MPRAAANALLGRHPLEVRELSFTLERARAPLEGRPADPSDDPYASARARVVLTQGWPKLIGREHLCPRAVTLSRRHLVLSFDGARLLATRIGVNPVRLHRKDARGAPVHVRIERDTTEPVFPEDVVEASPGICFRVRDARARFAPAPEAALARDGDFDVEKRWPSPEKRWPSPEKRWPSPEKWLPSPEKWLPSPEKRLPSASPSRAPSSSRSRAVSGAHPRRGARGRRETRGGGRARKPKDENEEAKDADAADDANSDADDDAADAGLDLGGISRASTPLLCLRGEEMFASFVREMERRVAATTWAREVKRKLLGGFEGDRPPPSSDDDANRSGSNSTDSTVPSGTGPRRTNRRCESNGGVFETVARRSRDCRAKNRSSEDDDEDGDFDRLEDGDFDRLEDGDVDRLSRDTSYGDFDAARRDAGGSGSTRAAR